MTDRDKGTTSSMLDFTLLDLKKRFTFEEAAHYWFEIDPDRYNNGISDEIWSKVIKMEDILRSAASEGKIPGYTPYSWLADTPGTLHRLGLERFAKRIGHKPLFLFPEQRKARVEQEKKSIFPCPEAKWENITITLIANDTVRIRTPNGEGRFSYHELQMADKRKGDQPTVLWPLLTFFIKQKGFISSQNPQYDPKLPDMAKRLNRHFKRLFGINESIYAGHYKKENGYRVRFIVSDRIFNDHPEISE